MINRLLHLLTIVALLSLWLVLGISARSMAATSLEQEFQCPFDGERWKERIETSSRPTGLRLDAKQLGDIVQPRVLPQCPKCGFVLFGENFDEEVLKKLKPFVLGGDYQIIAGKSPSYACLALLQEFLEAPPIYSAYSYLRASWQVEEKPALCRRYLARAYERFLQALEDMAPEHRDRLNIVLLVGELERRLERWEEAERRFRDLLDSDDFKKEPRMAPIVNFQLELIAARDSAPRALDARGKIRQAPTVPLSLSEPPPPLEPEVPGSTPPEAKPLDLKKPLLLEGSPIGQ